MTTGSVNIVKITIAKLRYHADYYSEFCCVLFDDGSCFPILLYEGGGEGAAGEGFEAEGAGAGEDVENGGTGEMVGYGVEDGGAFAFAHGVGGGRDLENCVFIKTGGDANMRRDKMPTSATSVD